MISLCELLPISHAISNELHARLSLVDQESELHATNALGTVDEMTFIPSRSHINVTVLHEKSAPFEPFCTTFIHLSGKVFPHAGCNLHPCHTPP